MRKNFFLLVAAIMVMNGMNALSQEINVRTDHPRLLLVQEEQSTLIDQFKSHPVWKRVEVNATNDYVSSIEGYFDAACGGIYTTVTGDNVNVSRIVKALKDFKNYGSETRWSYWGRVLRATAMAYDQAYNDMSEADREECANSILIEMEKAHTIYQNWDLSALNNRGTQITSGIIMGCLTIWEYMPNHDLFDWAMGKLHDIIAAQHLMGPNGGWYEGAGPYSEAVMTDSWMTMECLQRAAGIDLITPNIELIRGTGNWVVQVHDGAHYNAGWDDCMLGRFEYRNWNVLAYAAKLTNDPMLQDWTIYYEDLYNETMSITSGEIWRMLLFYDPALPASGRLTMPLAYTTGVNDSEFGMGLVTGRSSWSEDAVYFSFATKDYFGHHGHMDDGSFTLSYGENQIAIDAGYTSGSPDGKDSQYHNTLRIPGSEPVGPFSSFAGIGGSQIYNGYPEPRDSTELFDLQNFYRLGELKYFYQNNGIIYGCADVSNAYRNDIKFVRHVMLLQPDIVLIYDNVNRPNTYVMYAPEDADIQANGKEFSYGGMQARAIGADQSVQVEPHYNIPVKDNYPANRISFSSNGNHAVVFAFGRDIPDVEYHFNDMAAGGKWIVDGKIYMISTDPDLPQISSIGGVISDENGNPLSGVTVTLSGDESLTITTSGDGSYAFNVSAGDYIITPSLSGQISLPRRRKICGNYFDVNDLNFKMFTPVYYHISGSISDSSGNPLSDIKVNLSDEETYLTSATDQSGDFGFDVIAGTYTITPEEGVYMFNPQKAKVTVTEFDVSGIKFIGQPITYYPISGTITRENAGLADVVVTLTGDVTAADTTDANGNFEFAKVREGANITITPTRVGYFFTPPIININNLFADYTGQNFKADTKFFGTINFENGSYAPFSMEINLQGLTNWVVGDFGGKDHYELMGDPTKGGSGFKSSILTIPCVYDDVELKALYRPSDCWEGPLALRVQDASDSYFLWAGSNRDMLEIVYEQAGNRTFLVQKDKWDDGTTMNITPDNWYAVQLRAIGQTLTGSVQQLDDQFQPISGRYAQVSVEDNNLTQGYVGTRSAAGSKNLPYLIDDFQVINVTSSSVDDKSDQKNKLPQSFVLEQNFPNPFNPTTTINFSIPEKYKGRASLSIYNINGALVKELINKEMSAGYHSVQWDGTDWNGQKLSSGLYLYKLNVGKNVQSRKMLLLK
ncbi:MAG: T9SS type A sorting domain-containing protein [Calditrichaeota bacterium]|nr:T9SS type A sorting domain-containing protein [Calditrichota bacterium]